MTDTRKGANKTVPRHQDNELDELRTAVERLREDMTRLQSGLPNPQQVKKNLDEAWNAIKQLQQYRDEDNESLSIVVDDIAQRHEELMENLNSVHKELESSIRSGNIHTSTYPSEEKLYSFLGIQAPKSTWVTILKVVAGLVVMAGGAYVAYRYLSSSNDSQESRVVVM